MKFVNLAIMVNKKFINIIEKILILATYILARGLVCPYVIYNCLRFLSIPTIVKIICVSIFVQSTFYIKRYIILFFFLSILFLFYLFIIIFKNVQTS